MRFDFVERRQFYWKREICITHHDIPDVRRRVPIRIGCLHCANFEFAAQSSGGQLRLQEAGDESGDFVAVEKAESAVD